MAGVVSKDFQFIHTVYANNEARSEVFGVVSKLLSEVESVTELKVKSIHRIKANLVPKQILDEEGLAETIHIDVDTSDKKFVTIVYYVIDSDGDTVLYKDDGSIALQVTPRKGTAVYFPSNMKHRATPPVEHKRRIVLNIIVEVE